MLFSAKTVLICKTRKSCFEATSHYNLFWLIMISAAEITLKKVFQGKSPAIQWVKQWVQLYCYGCWIWWLPPDASKPHDRSDLNMVVDHLTSRSLNRMAGVMKIAFSNAFFETVAYFDSNFRLFLFPMIQWKQVFHASSMQHTVQLLSCHDNVIK